MFAFIKPKYLKSVKDRFCIKLVFKFSLNFYVPNLILSIHCLDWLCLRTTEMLEGQYNHTMEQANIIIRCLGTGKEMDQKSP